MDPDRIVMGGIDARTHELLDELYAPFEKAAKMHTTNPTVEMTKYASNALLATLISFSNEIGNLCTEMDNVDVMDVMKGVKLDERFSPIQKDGTRVNPGFHSYLEAGCGFGGSCFPKDVKALIAYGNEIGKSTRVLDAVIETNEQQPHRVLQLLEKHLPSVHETSVAVLGLAFNPGTDDIRESPAIPIVNELQVRGARVKMYDPVAQSRARKRIGEAENLFYCQDLATAVQGCSAVLIVTRWSEFEQLPSILSDSTTQPVVVDGRRMLEPQSVAIYEGIGY
jgi:UDPglucose 6-dehydrogenase/GDP-mannose 6-dehydrogenase